MARNKRISFLAELTKGSKTVLDIGTDHGLVLLEALKKGYIENAIASDLREKPLAQAKKILAGYNVSYFQSNGFESIKMPFDLAIIAGMGANLIGDILQKAPFGKQIYILQANDKIELLRQFLCENEFKIIDEFIIEDKFDYVVLKVCRGKMDLLEQDLYLGPILKYKPEAMKYYQKKAKQIKKIMLKVDEKRYDVLDKMYRIYQNL